MAVTVVGLGVIPESAIPARYRVQVMDRSFQILDAIGAAAQPISPAELGEGLKLHKSTIHRLLVVLEHERFIRRTVEGKYGLGTKLIEMGSLAMAQLDLRQHALPFLRRLVDEVGETAHISVLSETEMMSVAYVTGRWTLSTPSTVGTRTQIYCTSMGKAFIASLPPEQLDLLLARVELKPCTARTITNADDLRAELLRIRRRGYAVDNEEVEEGLRCVAAPVRDYTGRVVAAISVAGPIFRIQRRSIATIARAVIKASDGLSSDLGYVRHSSRRRTRTDS